MESFFGSGQFIIVMAALITTVLVVCGACLQPKFGGNTLGWGCLAIVLLLLLGAAIAAIAANREDAVTRSDVRVISAERYRAELGCTSRVMDVLTCVSALALIGAIVACVCVDVKQGSWHGGALLLSALVLFTVAVVALEPRSHALVRGCDADIYRITFNTIPNDQQSGAAHCTDSNQAAVPPNTFVVTVGLDPSVVDPNATLKSCVASSPQHGVV
ncbi:major surface protein 1a-like protein 2 (MLP2-2) [Anaplasma centrale str. Israel]|uniref:Major surface protein 1a-like protein 2 (MLP2-1) n=2 Tax=Anaplasma centrale TaxID=769 RepID=D1AS66_ANACI|nr:major surface protein 1a-like protein 2 (MLP2-1) [Anaplasma centrale str. Israel]ACZ49322.1 major surface protein 1a-like protein 2 (MLP2-2) [Anaplasma centrale str. Israel]